MLAAELSFQFLLTDVNISVVTLNTRPSSSPGKYVLETSVVIALIALALQTNQTPVVSYRQPMTNVLTSWGLNFTPHALSHYNGSKPRTDAQNVKDRKMCELLAYFIDTLQKTKDVDGSSLYDHVFDYFE